MLILRMATRNLWRQVGRNSLSMVSIIMGVFVMVLGRGMAGGFDENAIRAQIDSVSGHVLAVPAEYPEAGMRHPVDHSYAVTPENRTWLDENSEAWTPRIVAAPRAIAGRESMRVRMIGVSETDTSVFPRAFWKLTGAYPESDTLQILVGKKPAGLLGVGVGDVVTLESRTVDGAINAMRFTVSGVLDTGNPMIDNVGVFVPIDGADQLLNAQGRVTHIAAKVSNRNRNQALAEGMALQFPTAEVRTWQSEVEAMLETGKMRSTMFNIMGIALLLMAATGIANTVLMAAYERVREIGTLRSMGLQRSGIVAMFALEGFWMGVVGGFIGMVSSGLLNSYLSTNGLNLVEMMKGKADSMSNVPIAAMLYFEFSYSSLFSAWAVAIVVAVLASIYPAVSASNISPAEAVRAQ